MLDIQRHVKMCALVVLIVGVAAATACVPSSSEERVEPASGGPVAAKIGDRTITLDELDQQAQTSNMKAYQALYDARKAALDQIISQELIETEAAARGVSVEELIRTEIEQRSQPVTDSDIELFYKQQQARLQGQTLDQLREQIRGFLIRQNNIVAQQELIEELREKVGVQVSIDPPRAEIVVAEGEMQKGPDTAKVTIVEYSDFQ